MQKKSLPKKQTGGSSDKMKQAHKNLDIARAKMDSMSKVIDAKRVANRAADSTQMAKLDSLIKNTPNYQFRKNGGQIKTKKKK